jgi:hypothetical protein
VIVRSWCACRPSCVSEASVCSECARLHGMMSTIGEVSVRAAGPSAENAGAGAHRPRGTIRCRFDLPTPVACVAVAPGGAVVAAGGDRVLTVYDAARGDLIVRFAVPSDQECYVRSVRPSSPTHPLPSSTSSHASSASSTSLTPRPAHAF